MSRTFATRPHYIIAAGLEKAGRATPKHSPTCVEFNYDRADRWDRRAYDRLASRGPIRPTPCTLGQHGSKCRWDIPNLRDHEITYGYGRYRLTNIPDERLRREKRENLNSMRREYNHYGDIEDDDWVSNLMPRRYWY